MPNGVGYVGAVGSGAASGAGMGASIGSVIPGVGTAAGAGVGALVGGISGGLKEKRSQDAQNIPSVDPMERARLARLEQVSKNLSSGTDTLTQQGIKEQRNIGKAAQTAISRNTGGDVGGTIDALLKSQKATQGGVNQTVAQSAQRIPYFDSAVGALKSRIGQRRLELDLLNRSQRVAEAAQSRTDANVNTQALLATEGGTQTIPEGVMAAKSAIGDFVAARQAKKAGITDSSFADTQGQGLPTGALTSGSGLNDGVEVLNAPAPSNLVYNDQNPF